MSHLKILFVFIYIFSTHSNALFAQKRQLEKAVKQGHHGAKMEYVASFKNLKVGKKEEIRKWCTSNDFLLLNILTNTKERFGSGPEIFIRKATFRSQEDDFYLRNDASLKGFENYLSRYPNGTHKSNATNALFRYCEEIYDYSRLSKKFPALKDKLTSLAFGKVKNSYKYNLKWHTDFLKYFGTSEYAETVQSKICNLALNFDECISTIKKFPTTMSCLSKQAASEVIISKSYNDCSIFLEFFDNSYTELKDQVWKTFLLQLNTIERCSEQLKIHPNKKRLILSRAKLIAKNGNFDVKRKYLKRIPYSSDYEYFNDLVASEDKRIYDEQKLAEQKRIRAEKLRKEKIEAARIAEIIKNEAASKAKKEKEAKELAIKKAWIARYSNSNNWKLGCSLCKLRKGQAVVLGKLDQFNSDKSKIKVKVLAANGIRRIENESIYKGDYIWVSTKGWYQCIGNEEFNFGLRSREEEIVYKQKQQEEQRQQVIDNNKPKYDFGNHVKSIDMGRGSFWAGTIIDIRNKVYQVELDDISVKGSFFTIYLSPSACTGNKRLETADQNGSKIWVPEYCIKY